MIKLYFAPKLDGTRISTCHAVYLCDDVAVDVDFPLPSSSFIHGRHTPLHKLPKLLLFCSSNGLFLPCLTTLFQFFHPIPSEVLKNKTNKPYAKLKKKKKKKEKRKNSNGKQNGSMFFCLSSSSSKQIEN